MSTWYTIHGECELVIAQAMSDEGKVRFIPVDMTRLPPGHSVNSLGHPALCVVSIPRSVRGEFEERVAKLKA